MNTTGFPSPAQGYEKNTLDFNALLLKHPASTFTMRYKGLSIPEENICSGDILIIDCNLFPSAHKLAIISNGEGFQLARLFDTKEDENNLFALDFQGNRVPVIQLFGILSGIVRVL